MKIKVWGARGSTPSPLEPVAIEEKICQAILKMPAINTRDTDVVRAYVRGLPPLLRGTAGGNTSCVEVQADGKTFIIDAGSGIRSLGLELMKGPCGKGQGVLYLFFSHAHWDHIQGFPFFTPAYIPGNRIVIYSVHDLEMVLTDQQRYLNFPVPLSYMQASLEFVKLEVGTPLSFGRVTINSLCNSHPSDAYSFRFEDPHSVFVYASDAEYKDLEGDHIKTHLEFFRDADALVFDAQYGLRESWESKADWGHSSAMIGVDFARKAGVKRLLLFHHEPVYSDTQLQNIQETAANYQAQDASRPTCEVMVAYEGLTLDLTPTGAIDWQVIPDKEAAILTASSTFDEQGVDYLSAHLAQLTTADGAIGSVLDLSQVERLTTASLKKLITLSQQHDEGPLVLAAPSREVEQVIRLGGYRDYFAIYPSVEDAVTAVQARKALNLPGQTINNMYQIVEKLGEGHIGTTLKVIELQQKRNAALKILSPTFGEEAIDCFARQVQQLLDLEHRNIVPVLDCDWSQDGNYTFIVEQLMTGPTLHERLRNSHESVSTDEALDIATDIILALEHAHSHGVIHGDLKPQNIFFTDEGLKVGGFGLGRLVEGRNLLDAPLLHLDASYLAPEQILGQTIDARTDLYALGVIFYRLATGHLPFEGNDTEILEAHLHQDPRPPRELNPNISLSLEHLILKHLAKNPNDRYASAQQARRISSSLIIDSAEANRQRKRILIGRETQLSALQQCWEKARRGHGQLVFIVGEPGIGKTALAQKAAAQSETPILLIGHCQEHAENPAYHPFTEALSTYFATVPPELFERESHHFLSNFVRLVPEIRQTLAFLPDPPLLKPKQEQLRLMISLAEFIKHACRKRPWLLILDDLQWADQSSLALLRYISHHLPSMALLIIGIYRDVEVGQEHPLQQTLHDLNSYPTYVHFSLDRLDAEDVRQILSQIWQEGVPGPLVEKIYQHTGGNPFYVEEVAKALIDDGFITWQDGVWHFPELEELRLPHSMHEAAWRRIHHLSPDTQALLRQAAVLGSTFKFEDLWEMSGLSRWEVLEHLDMALERQLVQETWGHTRLRFKHAEIQYVLYTDMGTLRRRMLHYQAGEAIERRALPEPERFAEDLAHHFAEAGEFDRALVYAIQAARQAEAVYANEAALNWYHRTLEMLDQLPPEEITIFRPLRVAVLRSIGKLQQLVGRWDRAHSFYQQALELADQLDDQETQAWCQADIGELLRKQGRYAEAVAWLAYARTAFEELDDQSGVGQVLHYAGMLAAQRNDHEEARTLYEESLAIRRHLNDKPNIATLLSNLAVTAQREGDYEAARRFYEQSLTIRRELKDKWAIADTLNNLGCLAILEQKDYSQAQAQLEEAVALLEEVGDMWTIASALNNLGNVARAQGDYQKAQTLYEESLAINRELDDIEAIEYAFQIDG